MEWGPDEVGRYGPLISRTRTSTYVSETEQEPFQGEVFAAKNAPKTNCLRPSKDDLVNFNQCSACTYKRKERRESVEIRTRSICKDTLTTVSSVQFTPA